MQSQQQYNAYPYWQQAVYPQQQSHPVYPQSLPGPANGVGYNSTPFPSNFIPLGPQPTGFPTGYQQEPPTPRQQQNQKSKHRRTKTVAAIPSTPASHLKPALKKNNTVSAAFPAEHNLPRSRTNSISRPLHRIRTQSNPRQHRTGSVIGDENHAHHLFLSFCGFNELRLGNISTLALKEMQETIWPLWPGGATSQVVNYTAIVKFFNDPWDLSGPNVDIACEMIIKLFRLCAARGYSYQTSYNQITVPQLIFQPNSCDETANFFLGYLSNGGRKLTLIKAPDPVNVGFNPRLRDILPPNLVMDLGGDGDLQTVEVKKGGWRFGGSGGLSPTLFFMQVLRVISDFGYYLDAAIPLYRRGPLGVRLRREILVFKGRTAV